MNNSEMNMLIAEAIGVKVCKCDPNRPSPRYSADTGDCLTCEGQICPAFDTDCRASKQLRTAMEKLGWSWGINYMGAQSHYYARFLDITGYVGAANSPREETAVVRAACYALGLTLC